MLLGDEACEALYLDTIAEKERRCTFVPPDIDIEDLYRQFQEANFTEYFDPARTYRYCKWH